MRRIYVYLFSFLLFLIISAGKLHAQDTISVPLKIKAGADVSGPAIYMSDKNILNYEGCISVDLNEKLSLAFNAGYSNFRYSQYNYEFLNKGVFIRAGIDLNLLKPDKAQGKYWAGIGFRYGLSLYNSEVPSFKKENYWDTTYSSISKSSYAGHFLEVSPGIRAEIFKNFSIGWNINLRMLLAAGTGRDLRPVSFPGYGNGGKSLVTGMSYFFVLNIPYKRINVILKKDVPEESTPADTRQSSGIRP